MAEGRGGVEEEREREEIPGVTLYQEEWTPLLLSLAAEEAGERGRQMLVNPLIDTNRY